MRTQKGNTTVGFIVVLFWLWVVIGYFLNIFFLVKTAMAGITIAEMTLFFVIQVIGVFVPPLGAITGFMYLLF